MNRFNYLLIILSFAVSGFLFCCKNRPGLAHEEKVIRELLQQERKAHFDRDAGLFISEFADSMISVNKGKVTVASPEENKKRTAAYFSNAKFIKWDDVAEPVIHFSDDGSLAYAVVQKQVILLQPAIPGKVVYDTTDYAWVSIYRKQKGEWKIECNISTNK